MGWSFYTPPLVIDQGQPVFLSPGLAEILRWPSLVSQHLKTGKPASRSLGDQRAPMRQTNPLYSLIRTSCMNVLMLFAFSIQYQASLTWRDNLSKCRVCRTWRNGVCFRLGTLHSPGLVLSLSLAYGCDDAFVMFSVQHH